MKKYFNILANMTFQKVTIIGLILGALYYMTLFDDGAAIDTQIETVKVQLAEQEKKQKESDEALKEVEQVRAQVISLSDQYKVISTQLPTEIQMAEVLRTIDSIATATGVSIKSKEPQKTENKDILEEMPIRVTAEGKFSELTMFLYNMMNTERISKVSNLSIMRPPNENGRKLKRGLVLEAKFANYRFIGDAGKIEAGKEVKK